MRRVAHLYAICVVFVLIGIGYIPGCGRWSDRKGFEWMRVVWATE